jgi:hypothetical protein
MYLLIFKLDNAASYFFVPVTFQSMLRLDH